MKTTVLAILLFVVSLRAFGSDSVTFSRVQCFAANQSTPIFDGLLLNANVTQADKVSGRMLYDFIQRQGQAILLDSASITASTLSREICKKEDGLISTPTFLSVTRSRFISISGCQPKVVTKITSSPSLRPEWLNSENVPLSPYAMSIKPVVLQSLVPPLRVLASAMSQFTQSSTCFIPF